MKTFIRNLVKMALVVLLLQVPPVLADQIKSISIVEVSQDGILTSVQGTKVALHGLVVDPAFQGEVRARLQRRLAETKQEVRGEEVYQDRYGRCSCQVYLADGRWLQGDLLRSGLARVDVENPSLNLGREMLVLENMARNKRQGMWAEASYQKRDAYRLPRTSWTSGYAMVEGTVVDAREIKGTIYLNFDENWRKDFSVAISKKDQKPFKMQGFDLLDLKGRRIRVRGWLKSRNGPMIEVNQVAQIEVLP